MRRREFVQMATGAATMAGLGPNLFAQTAKKKPLNVLFLMMDQHHHRVMGCAGNPVVKTPNLDRLAREGVRFSNAVCATPFCSPTRGSLVTGQWPHTHGIVVNCKPRNPGLTTDDNTTEGILRAQRYATEQIGKWHIGTKSDLECYRQSLPIRERMTAHREFLKKQNFEPPPPRKGEKLAGKSPVYMTDWNHAAWEKRNAAEGENKKGQDLLVIGREATPAKWEFWGGLADEAVRRLKQHRDRNFMLTYSAGPPHALWHAPDPYYSMYDPAAVPFSKTFSHAAPEAYAKSGPVQRGKYLGEKGFREMIRCYYAQVTMIDAYVGRILDTLDELGLSQNTLVIYLSDHGDMQGGQGGMLGKSVSAFFEEIVRVPFIMRLPGVIPAGKVVRAHANSVDVCPTILDYLGLSIPKSVQGRSLRPIIEGREPDAVGHGFSERPGGRMIRTDGWKHCFFFRNKTSREELYDLKNDPHETTNLAGNPKHAKQKAKLRDRLAQHLKRTGDMDFDDLVATSARPPAQAPQQRPKRPRMRKN